MIRKAVLLESWTLIATRTFETCLSRKDVNCSSRRKFAVAFFSFKKGILCIRKEIKPMLAMILYLWFFTKKSRSWSSGVHFFLERTRHFDKNVHMVVFWFVALSTLTEMTWALGSPRDRTLYSVSSDGSATGVFSIICSCLMRAQDNLHRVASNDSFALGIKLSIKAMASFQRFNSCRHSAEYCAWV